ncbi:hypothetical protein C2E23DRAFT_334248 [Lenzites betulinus]|nr:hypothetical protein C2E23DRAFT_334248 [Lenzites betulinus]
MAEEEELEGPDLETLRAQIDMSMAFTHNIVSSWMKSSKAKLPSSSARNDDRDLEEYMRKPARLGVGAAVPEATGVLGRESVKLRNKLTGMGKKREREDEAGPSATGAAARTGAGGAAAQSDDEDRDSKARVVTKKARVDPFAVKGDGKKKKKKGDPTVPSAGKAKNTSRSELAAPGTEMVDDVEMGEAHEAVGRAKTPANEPATTAPSKQKKKKHKAGSHDAAAGPSHAAAQHDVAASSNPEKKRVASISGPTGSSGASVPPTHPGKKASMDGPTSGTVFAPPENATVPSDVSAGARKGPSTTDQVPLGLPLLNLSGPPATDGQPSGSPKKKRKRKKKKKKTAAQAQPDAMHEEGEDEESDDD